ncbi:MAG: hypothetical protein HDR00_06370 [Lachnospiraceae bacterium]|nr:hypothetical protein [Lachnospiraceae bacterium]
MNRIEFLERLEALLADVPYTERREALNYYTEYFEDAEKEDEEVIKTLGSPEEVAHNIREELAGKELTESAQDGRSEEGAYSSNSEYVHEGSDGKTYESAGTQDKKLEGWQVALIVIAIVLTVPLWGGLICGAAGAAVGVIAAFFAIILALATTAVACLIAAVIVFVIAIIKFVISPLASVFLIGLSVLLLGISMLCMIASWKSITVLIPAIWQGIVYIFRSIFRRKEGVAA